MKTPRLRRRLHHTGDFRLARHVASGMLLEPYRPILVFLTVTRRCNLSCGYCHEYDQTSAPVPRDVLFERIEHLARLRTVVVNLNGGEPLLHPDIVELVSFVRACGMVPAINTNGFLLSRDLIRGFNEAGLNTLQISADAVRPNETTKKALVSLLPKFRILAEEAKFRVRVNTVFGAAAPEESVEVVRVALAHGFEAKCALLRDPSGRPIAYDERARRAYAELSATEGRHLGVLGEAFQERLLVDGRADMKCRAGSRFFQVCEKGLVHLCAPRHGDHPTPLSEYGEEDLRAAFQTQKRCAATCGVAFAHQVSRLDHFRRQTAHEPSPASRLPILQAGVQ